MTNFTGISLKVSNKRNAKVPISNPGHGELDKKFGTDTQHHRQAAVDRIEKKHPELKTSSRATRKHIIKNNPQIKASVSHEHKKALSDIADHYHEKLHSMSSEHRAEHLRTLLHAHKTTIPHLRVISGGTGGHYSHSAIDPHEHYNNYLHDHKNIHVHRTGGASISFEHHHPLSGKKTRIATLRLKHETTSDSRANVKGSVSD